MKITKYIHSCLLIEKGDDRILFDPGKFTFMNGEVKPSQFDNIQAIIITHKHPDHIDGESLKEIIKNNENVVVLGNTDVVKMLAEKDIEAKVFESGEMTISSFVIKAYDAKHEKILADELPQNTAYVVDDKILHPGDSYDERLYKLKGTPILCLPIMAPWANEPQTFEFAKNILPKYVLPIHDGYSKDFFLEMRYEAFGKFLEKENIKFEWMNKAGDYFEV